MMLELEALSLILTMLKKYNMENLPNQEPMPHNHSGGESRKVKFADLDCQPLEAASTKTTPGTVDGWIKIVINGTIYYVPIYTSKTS
jgi:hypothetical protein